MSEVRVEVLPESTPGDGSRAVIRLNGIYYLPADVTFRLDPVDGRINGDADPGWPGGDRKPSGSRLSATGIEMHIGPDIVEARLLAPGTPVRISIPAAAVKEEIRWPDIGPRSRRGARTTTLPSPPPTNAADTEKPTDENVKGEDTTEAPGADEVRSTTSGSEEPATPVWLQNPDPSTQTAPRRPSLAMPFAIGFLLAAVFGAGGWLLFDREIVQYIDRLAAQTRTLGQPARAPEPVSDVFSAIANTPDLSPRGDSAEGVDIATALARSDGSLKAVPPDHAEARFWLSKAIALALGQKEMTAALTQLGTLYANREGGQRSYAYARILWELAAAQGDPTALCSLGRLYAQGLGVSKDPARAEELFAKARKLGNCDPATAALRRP